MMEIRVVRNQFKGNVFIKIHPILSKIILLENSIKIPFFVKFIHLFYKQKCIKIYCEERIELDVCTVCDKYFLYEFKCDCKDLKIEKLILGFKVIRNGGKSIDLGKLFIYLNSVYAKKIYIYKNNMMHKNKKEYSKFRNSKISEKKFSLYHSESETFLLDTECLDEKYLRYIYEHIPFVISYVKLKSLKKLYFLLNVKKNDLLYPKLLKNIHLRQKYYNEEFIMGLMYHQISFKYNYISSFSYYYFLNVLDKNNMCIKEKEESQSKSIFRKIKSKLSMVEEMRILPKFYFLDNNSLYGTEKMINNFLKLDKSINCYTEGILQYKNNSTNIIKSKIEIIFLIKGLQIFMHRFNSKFKDVKDIFSGIKDSIKMNHVSLFDNQIKIDEFLINQTKVHNTKTLPIETTFLANGKVIRYLYKPNTNVIKDYFFTKLIRQIYRILGVKTISYNVLPCDNKSGIIEIQDSTSISNFETFESFKKLFFKRQEESYDVLDNFLKSFSASLIITKLFEIGDRTLDNMMITKKGDFFHIDFEYVLGEDPKFFKPKIIIPKIISQFLISDSLIYEKFKYYLIEYYRVIRRDNLKILTYSKILYYNIVQIVDSERIEDKVINLKNLTFSFEKMETVFLKNLELNSSNEYSESMLLYQVNTSINSYKTNILHFINYLGKKYRQI